MDTATDNDSSTLTRHTLEQIVTRSSEGVMLLDARDEAHPVVYVNPAFETLTGYSAAEVVGQPWSTLQRDRGDPGLDELHAAIERLEPAEIDLPDLRKDGTVFSSHVAFSPLRDARGDIRYLLILQRESVEKPAEGSNVEVGLLRRELGRARQKLDYISRVDGVTGLPRYEDFAAVLNRDLAIAARDRRAVALMVFEIIELDVYRKTFGNKAADSCVRMIGAQISGTLRRAGDLCARYDDSVLVACALGQDEAQAKSLAARVVDNVRGLRLHNPHAKSGRYITIVCGVAAGVPRPGDDTDSLVDRARKSIGANAAPSGKTSYA